MSFPPHPVQAPPGDFPLLDGANWDPDALGWTFDTCANVMVGLTVRRQEDYPCDPPFPCGDRNWAPGMFEPITLHPIRSVNRTNIEGQQDGYANREVCEYCYGVAAMTTRGLIAFVLFTKPDLEDWDLVSQSAWKISMGAFFMCRKDDPTGLCEAGLLAGIVSIPLPPWRVLHLNSGKSGCAVKK